MNKIIQHILAEFQDNILAIFSSSDHLTLAQIEEAITEPFKQSICQIISAYASQLDEHIHNNKAGRKKEGLVVVRTKDKRTLLTTFGEVTYHRTCYRSTKSGQYQHPVDDLLATGPYARISDQLALTLAEAAQKMSYAQSAQYAAAGQISRQSVMRALRRAQPKEAVLPEQLKKVSALHIDADEDHVALQHGKRTIVPLISVYEGMEGPESRRSCKNVFHISEYGWETADLWEKVLSELEKRYDLEGTTIYLHGDGAAWIIAGLEWLPNSQHVLDKFHKNKAIKKACAGFEAKEGKELADRLRQALNEGDSQAALMIIEAMEQEKPERAKQIEKAAGYLLKHIEAIAICQKDEEANNGGSTEPHVSHILSRRLSSRPMGWSKETLEKLAPMLAGKGSIEIKRRTKELTPIEKKAEQAARRKCQIKNSLGLPEVSAIGRLKAIAEGKKNPTYKSIAPYA